MVSQPADRQQFPSSHADTASSRSAPPQQTGRRSLVVVGAVLALFLVLGSLSLVSGSGGSTTSSVTPTTGGGENEGRSDQVSSAASTLQLRHQERRGKSNKRAAQEQRVRTTARDGAEAAAEDRDQSTKGPGTARVYEEEKEKEEATRAEEDGNRGKKAGGEVGPTMKMQPSSPGEKTADPAEERGNLGNDEVVVGRGRSQDTPRNGGRGQGSQQWDLRSLFPRPLTPRTSTRHYKDLSRYMFEQFSEVSFKTAAHMSSSNNSEKDNDNDTDGRGAEGKEVVGGEGAGGEREATTAGRTSQQWVTKYRKHPCGAVVTNFCIKSGQPRYFIKKKASPTQGWATRMCNEGISKYKMNLVMYEPGTQPPYEYRPNSILVAPFCWELYGYHLLLCLLATFSHLEGLQVPQLIAEHPGTTVSVSLLKGFKETPYYVGSASNWTGANRSPDLIMESKAKPSQYWRLWQLISDHPNNIWPLPDTPTQCFSLGIFGGPPSTEATPEDAQAMRSAIVERLGLEPVTSRKCKKYRVTVVLRRQFKILNLDNVLDALRLHLGGGSGAGGGGGGAGGDSTPAAPGDGATTSTASSNNHTKRNRGAMRRVVIKKVYWEQLPLIEQLQIAIETDLMVGVHGNGLSWSLMMPPHGAILELWPSAPYNENYLQFALKANLAHFHSRGNGDCRARCSARYNKLDHVLPQIKKHLDDVACHGLELNTTATWLKNQQEAKERKEEKQRIKNLMPGALPGTYMLPRKSRP